MSMNRFILPLLAAVAIVTGYRPVESWLEHYLPLTSEDKLVAALPLGPARQSQIKRIIDSATPTAKARFGLELNSRLKIRALSCTQGFQAKWYQSREAINASVGHSQCLDDQEQSITQWLGIIEAGQLLAMPPLREAAGEPVGLVQVNSGIREIKYARQAAIALLGSGNDLAVVDLHSGEVLHRDPWQTTQGTLSELSANGRLYARDAGRLLSIVDAASGTEVVRIPDAMGHAFFWLDDHTAVFGQISSGGAQLIDFDSGQLVDLGMPRSWSRALPMPGKPDHYLLLGGQHNVEIQVLRQSGLVQVRVVAQLDVDGYGRFAGLESNNPSRDGTRYYGSDDGLVLLDVSQLALTRIDTAPLRLTRVTTTPQVGQILLEGTAPGLRATDARRYIYEVTSQTIAPLSDPRYNASRLDYVPAFDVMALVEGNRITFHHDLATGSPQPLTLWRAQLADRQTARVAQAQQIQAIVQRVEYAPLKALAATAQVEGIGVYEAADGVHGGGTHAPGTVQVEVKPGRQPTVLVLSSYEPVRWRLRLQPGSQLGLVLMSGYYPSTVEGAGDARVVVIGAGFAYSQGSGEYQGLNQNVMRYTGKGIDLFQGTYSGRRFSVGGR
jgi:hypothetical protein